GRGRRSGRSGGRGRRSGRRGRHRRGRCGPGGPFGRGAGLEDHQSQGRSAQGGQEPPPRHPQAPGQHLGLGVRLADGLPNHRRGGRRHELPVRRRAQPDGEASVLVASASHPEIMPQARNQGCG
ncbi:MAG TPA: hypothetical protein DD388_05010, partial [Acidimicrobiaceae bacterium]|nr:hypothetical protein [Acidimicrobiaceae bacterium]